MSALLAALAVLGGGRSARAQPIADNNYAVDLYQGPILAPIRVTGIAGAYAGYGEGIAGFVANAASPAVREAFSVSWFDQDLSGSVSIPINIFENNDFDNNGSLDFDYSNFIYANLGGQLQFGPVGLGAIGELQRYTLTSPEGDDTAVTYGRYHVLGAVALMGGQLHLGAGARILTLGVDAPEANLTQAGLAPEIGLLVRPDWSSFRFGATFRFPVEGGELGGDDRRPDEDGVDRAGGLVVPNEVVLPWEIEAGIALQVGPRPINPEWIDPSDEEELLREQLIGERRARLEHMKVELAQLRSADERAAYQAAWLEEEHQRRADEGEQWERDLIRLKEARRARYQNWPRERILLTADLLVTGPVERGVGLEQFLGQSQVYSGRVSLVGTSGAEVNFSPRFGVETEPIPNLIMTRFGSYYEPSRYDRPVGRQHFTFGADLKLFDTTWFGLVPEVTYKIQTSVDVAPRYQSLSAGLGVWR